MPGRLEGKIAIVSGSNSGIGRAISLAYGREGAIVVCASRRPESATSSETESTHDLIIKNGGKAVYMKMAFSDTESVNNVTKEVVEKFGRIDVWVNVAGAGGVFKNIWELTDEEFNVPIDINLKGNFKCMRAAAQQMIKQDPDPAGLRGHIINIGSVFGNRGFPGTAGYSASRTGAMGIVRAAVMDLSPHKITVNVISPGTVMSAQTSELPDAMNDMLSRKALMGFGQPNDIAGAAVFLASDEAKWVQGAELFVDGGYTTS